MTANKHQKVRAALCWNIEIVKLARKHNDANVISIPSRFISLEEAIKITPLYTDPNPFAWDHNIKQEAEKIWQKVMKR